ncbi:hypothetical protein BJ508DRAFT_310348 [Ascobolus immersus RN42]|uniref:Uncharacterized protein n=1 Tax=Ascobolus immersus RN42 TaxID=1160509 RepID=A0A3N4HZJ6_ASCIM|nr:hypothetical protein BJ508DRAFT_310348 [Ascobolus immersus RN42]
MTSVVTDITAVFLLAKRLRKRFKDGPGQYKQAHSTLVDLINIVKEVDALLGENDEDDADDARINPASNTSRRGSQLVVSTSRRSTSSPIPAQSTQSRITELADDYDESEKNPKLNDADGSIRRAVERHILCCKMLLIEFEKKAQCWEDAISSSDYGGTAGKPARGFGSTITALITTGKTASASLSFSEKQMRKYISDIRGHVHALGTYISIGAAEAQKQMAKQVEEIKRATVRIEYTQTEILQMVEKVYSVTMGVQYMVSGSPWGPVETIMVKGTEGRITSVPMTVCQKVCDLVQVLAIGTRSSSCIVFEALHIYLENIGKTIKQSVRLHVQMYGMVKCPDCSEAVSAVPARQRDAPILPGDLVQLAVLLYPPYESGRNDIFAMTMEANDVGSHYFTDSFRIRLRDPSMLWGPPAHLEVIVESISSGSGMEPFLRHIEFDGEAYRDWRMLMANPKRELHHAVIITGRKREESDINYIAIYGIHGSFACQEKFEKSPTNCSFTNSIIPANNQMGYSQDTLQRGRHHVYDSEGPRCRKNTCGPSKY